MKTIALILLTLLLGVILGYAAYAGSLMLMGRPL